jgi:hypothetical protein
MTSETTNQYLYSNMQQYNEKLKQVNMMMKENETTKKKN